MKKLSLGELISGAEERLGIFYVSGNGGLVKEIRKPAVRRYSLGEMTSRNTLLIVSPADLFHVGGPSKSYASLFVQHFSNRKNPLIVISDQKVPLRDWVTFPEEREFVLCLSRYDAHVLESRLTGLVREKWDGIRMLHAGLVAVDGLGILLTGEPGSGKTACALDLLQRGHRWVADDAVILEKRSPGRITGHAHRAIKDLVHLRGRGILPVADCAGHGSYEEEVDIGLVVELNASGDKNPETWPAFDVRSIMGVPVPYLKLAHRNHAENVASTLLDMVHHNRQRGTWA